MAENEGDLLKATGTTATTGWDSTHTVEEPYLTKVADKDFRRLVGNATRKIVTKTSAGIVLQQKTFAPIYFRYGTSGNLQIQCYGNATVKLETGVNLTITGSASTINSVVLPKTTSTHEILTMDTTCGGIIYPGTGFGLPYDTELQSFEETVTVGSGNWEHEMAPISTSKKCLFYSSDTLANRSNGYLYQDIIDSTHPEIFNQYAYALSISIPYVLLQDLIDGAPDLASLSFSNILNTAIPYTILADGTPTPGFGGQYIWSNHILIHGSPFRNAAMRVTSDQIYSTAPAQINNFPIPMVQAHVGFRPEFPPDEFIPLIYDTMANDYNYAYYLALHAAIQKNKHKIEAWQKTYTSYYRVTTGANTAGYSLAVGGGIYNNTVLQNILKFNYGSTPTSYSILNYKTGESNTLFVAPAVHTFPTNEKFDGTPLLQFSSDYFLPVGYIPTMAYAAYPAYSNIQIQHTNINSSTEHFLSVKGDAGSYTGAGLTQYLYPIIIPVQIFTDDIWPEAQSVALSLTSRSVEVPEDTCIASDSLVSIIKNKQIKQVKAKEVQFDDYVIFKETKKHYYAHQVVSILPDHKRPRGIKFKYHLKDAPGLETGDVTFNLPHGIMLASGKIFQMLYTNYMTLVGQDILSADNKVYTIYAAEEVGEIDAIDIQLNNVEPLPISPHRILTGGPGMDFRKYMRFMSYFLRKKKYEDLPQCIKDIVREEDYPRSPLCKLSKFFGIKYLEKECQKVYKCSLAESVVLNADAFWTKIQYANRRYKWKRPLKIKKSRLR